MSQKIKMKIFVDLKAQMFTKLCLIYELYNSVILIININITI